MLSHYLDELKSLRLWVNYIRLWNPAKHNGAGGYDKPPINPLTCYDGRVNSDGCKTWTTYDQAAANIGKTATHYDTKHKDERGHAPQIRAAIEGVGLVMGRGVCGIDFDDVIDDDGNLKPWARDIVTRLDTYTEISPSGHGLHSLLFCGDLLTDGHADFGSRFPLDAAGNIIDDANKVSDIEIYFYRNGGRYLTFTGNVYSDKPINHSKGAELLKIHDEFKAKAAAWRSSKLKDKAPATRTTAPATATDDENRAMLESALMAADPADMEFNEWAAVMTALKVLGYGLDYAQDWSAGNKCGGINSKNDPATNAARWHKFNFKNGNDKAAGIIINAARRQGWTPAEAFEDEARTQYGRKLYTDQQRTEYGRTQHTAEERREYGRKLHSDEERAEYGRSLYTEKQRREYGRQKHLERIAQIDVKGYGRALRERAAKQQDAARIRDTGNPTIAKYYQRKKGD